MSSAWPSEGARTSAQPPPEFELTGVRVALGGRAVLDEVSLAIAAGQWTAVVGPNGAGKSTLLRTIALLQPLAGGELQWWGDSPRRMSPRERGRRVAWIGQGEDAPLALRVTDVVMLGRLPHQGWLGAPSPEDESAVDRALNRLELSVWRNRLLGELSGGERQRVMLARLLATQAPVWLFDEPLASLDLPHQSDWAALVREHVARGGTVVSVLHELDFALRADRLIVMVEGHVRYSGPADAQQARDAVVSVFDHRVRIRPLEDRWVALPA